MNHKNSDTDYGALAKFFHWASALIILSVIIAGLFMTGMENSPEKFAVFAAHKSFGILILILVCLRLGWRIYGPVAGALDTHAPWEKMLAKATHLFLYFTMIAMPLSGWIMSSAGEFPVPFFGLNLPPLTGKNEALAEAAEEFHELLALGLIGAIALHAAGAFKHYFIDRDNTLQRMIFSKHSLTPLFLMMVTALFFVAASYKYLAPGKPRPTEQTKQQIEMLEAQDVQSGIEKTVSYDQLPEHGWAVIHDATKIEFVASIYGQDFTGRFKEYDSDIIFDPDNLDESSIRVHIKTASAITGDKDRDANITNEDWFASDIYEYAIFRSAMIDHIQGNDYIAVGDLTIRGTTLPVSLPFTLDISEKDGLQEARVIGSASLNRLDFGIGQGQWEDTKAVGGPVRVQIDLTARRP